MAWNKFPDVKPVKSGEYIVFCNRKYRFMENTLNFVALRNFNPDIGCFEDYDLYKEKLVPVDYVMMWHEMPEAPDGYVNGVFGYRERKEYDNI